jgi:serine-type D-Ala-D-Ala carboxypeptidase/endopeptidase
MDSKKTRLWVYALVVGIALTAPFAGIAFTAPCKPQTSHQGQDKNRLTSLIQVLGEKMLKNSQMVGLSIGVFHNGTSSFYNFGTTEKGKAIVPTQNTIYEIGSITKTFTSFLLAKAVLENRVSLDDDIRKYLVGDYPNLEFNGRPIQLVHLANTTSELPDWLPPFTDEIKSATPESAAAIRAKVYGNYTRKDFYEALHKVRLEAPPGVNRKHSNSAAQLLAYILEAVYKAPLDKLLRTSITQPYKMENTSFLNAKSKSNIPLLAKGYNEKGAVMPYDFTMPYFQASGGLYSSAADLVKYIQLQLDEKNEIARRSQTRTINVDVLTNKVHPESKISSQVYSVGLNWFLYKPDGGKTQIWADGGTSGFCSYLVIYPELKSGIVLLSNQVDEKTFQALPGLAYDIFKLLEGK